MDLGSIFLLLGLFTLVSLYISRPFFTRKATAVNQEEHDLSVLLAEQERLISALQELEFDHVLGKIPAEDFPAQRAFLVARAVEIMRQVDEARAEWLPGDAEARLEVVIASRRADSAAAQGSGKKPIPSEASPDDELEAMLATRRRERSEKAAGFCPQCGKPFQLSDRFCSKCGATLVVDAEISK
jgi:hypothetical protein